MTTSRFYIPGGRVVKTGIAVFITVLICQLFNFPVIFAAITAIVSIEPTASESIKKGGIRFPAAVIGAAYSMTLTALIGNTAITYALSAMLTIVTCYKLKLDAGILVATLTAVNMIPVTHDHFFIAFLERIATTTIGIVVAAFVNLLILPPHYSGIIAKNTETILHNTREFLQKILDYSLNGKPTKNLHTRFEYLMKSLKKAEQLCENQKEEWRFHHHGKEEIREFHYTHKKLVILKQILYHLGNMMYLPLEQVHWENKERNRMQKMTELIASTLNLQSEGVQPEVYKEIKRIAKGLRSEILSIQLLSVEGEEPSQQATFKITICYELLSINKLIHDLYTVWEVEQKKTAPSSPKK